MHYPGPLVNSHAQIMNLLVLSSGCPTRKKHAALRSISAAGLENQKPSSDQSLTVLVGWTVYGG